MLASCGGAPKPSTPVDSFKAYVEAIKKKDLTSMKLLLSENSRKMKEQEARAKGVTLDDIMRSQSLISENQTSVTFKDQKINGDKATLEIRNQYGQFETMNFILEDGRWKIDEQGYAQQMINDIEQNQKKAFDDLINQGKQP
jgi:hypothetical protein